MKKIKPQRAQRIKGEVVVEIKAVESVPGIFEARLLTYLNAAGKKVGLIINFNVHSLKDGVKRMVFQGNTGGRKGCFI